MCSKDRVILYNKRRLDQGKKLITSYKLHVHVLPLRVASHLELISPPPAPMKARVFTTL